MISLLGCLLIRRGRYWGWALLFGSQVINAYIERWPDRTGLELLNVSHYSVT